MRDSFAQEIARARSFLKELAAHNTRDWFQDNKKAYEAVVKNPGNAIGAEIAGRLSPLTGGEMGYKLFRINRDVRFSKDKTPYNTHMHLLWSDGPGPGFFFGVSPDYVTAGCGVMGLHKARLTAYRALVDRNGAALAKEIEALLAQGYRLDDPELKRVPAPYDKAHPHGALLRRKSLALWSDMGADAIEVKHVLARFEALMPIYRVCQEIA